MQEVSTQSLFYIQVQTHEKSKKPRQEAMNPTHQQIRRSKTITVTNPSCCSHQYDILRHKLYGTNPSCGSHQYDKLCHKS